MKHLRLLFPLLLVASVTACETEAAESSESSTEPAVLENGDLDMRAVRPVASDEFLDFEGGEMTVLPGEDKMLCTHVRYDGDEAAFSDAQAIQGTKYGHHAIVMSAKEPLPSGTAEDCSKAEDMTKYDAFALPEPMPPGHGSILKAQQTIVMQSHYVNTGKKPIRIRDFVRLKKIDKAKVTTWIGMFATNTLTMKLPAKKATSISFDCTISQDGDLVLLGGHMHEWGKKIELLHGKTVADLRPLYTAPWKPEYRDLPPIELLWQKPVSLKKGDVFRTICTYDNDLDEDIIFPHEMCSSFGYIRGTKAAEICNITTDPVTTEETIVPENPDEETDGTDGADSSTVEGSTITLRFGVSSLVKTSRNLEDELRGAVYGNIYLADDVTLTGPREGAPVIATVELADVDLVSSEVSTASWTSPVVEPGDYMFLGMMDVDGNGSVDRDPDTGDPVTLPVDRFTVGKNERFEHTIQFDLVYAQSM